MQWCRTGTTIQRSRFSILQLDFCKQAPSSEQILKKKKGLRIAGEKREDQEEQETWQGGIQIKKHLDSLMWKYSHVWDKVTKSKV